MLGAFRNFIVALIVLIATLVYTLDYGFFAHYATVDITAFCIGHTACDTAKAMLALYGDSICAVADLATGDECRHIVRAVAENTADLA